MDDQTPLDEARAAAAKAQAEYARVRARNSEVREIATWMRDRRDTNHFAEMIRKALRGNT